jgi:hypothetical protein
MKLAETIIVALLSVFILIITLLSHVEFKKNDRTILKAQIRAMGNDTTGRIVYRWLLILVALCGFLWGPSAATYVLMLFALISERLTVYRVCRPNDALGRILDKFNW